MGQAPRTDPPRPNGPADSELLKAYRVYAAITGALLPLFWILYVLADPSAIDPLWQRLVLAAFAVSLLGLSYRSEAVRRRLIELMQGLLFLVTLWFIALAAVNGFSASYAVGLLFVIAAVAVGLSTGLRRIRPLTWYLVTAVGLTTLAALLLPGSTSHLVFIGCAASIALVIHVAASATIRANNLLRLSEQNYRKLFTAANDAILVVDAATLTILEANRKAVDTYGYENLTGIQVDVLAPAPWFDAVPAENIEVVHRSKDGSPVHLLVSTARIEYDGRPAYLSIHRDVTERLRNLENLSRANEALTRRNRDLQDFTTAASHDLQEPVRKMRTFADLIRQEFGASLDESGRNYIQRMQEIGGRMSNLIDALVDFAQIASRARPRVETDLNVPVRAALEDLEPEVARTGANISVGDLPSAFADPDQMCELFGRLIRNAIEARRDGVPPHIRVTGTAGDDGFCRVEVRDNGVGIDEKYFDRIFSPYRHLKSPRPQGRTGMGLAICKRIVEHHGGRITVESTLGVGSTFVIKLPRSDNMDYRALT